MRPLTASTVSVAKSGRSFVVTFENESAMTSTRISHSLVRGLVRDLESKLALADKPRRESGTGRL